MLILNRQWSLTFWLASAGVVIGYLVAKYPTTTLIMMSASLVGLASASSWPSVSLVGALSAGLFKAVPLLQPLSSIIDLTLLFAVLVFLNALLRLMRFRSCLTRLVRNRWFFGLFLAFCSAFIGGLIITPSPNYGLDKTLKFIGVAGPAVLLVLVWERRQLYQFLRMFFLFSCIVALDAMAHPKDPSGFVTAFSSNYLALSRQVGYGALIGFLYLLAQEGHAVRKLLVFSVSVMLTVVMLMSGGRGPVVAFILSMAVLFLYECVFTPGPILRRLKRSIPAVGLGFLVVVLTLVSPFGLFDTVKARFTLLARETGPSALTRVRLAKTALSTFSTNWLFGIGVGGFSKESAGFDCPEYPHNLFLETAAEMGTVGLALLTALIAVPLGRFHRAWNSMEVDDRSILRVTLALFVFALFNAFVSGDWTDNRMVVVALALLTSAVDGTSAGHARESVVLSGAVSTVFPDCGTTSAAPSPVRREDKE